MATRFFYGPVRRLLGWYPAILLLMLAAALPAAAQPAESLTLDKTLPGHDAVASSKVLAEHFSGVWNVVHNDADGRQRSGRAVVAGNGSDVSLVLSGPEGQEYYELVEADAVRFAEGTGKFLGGVSLRFSRTSEPVMTAEGEATAAARAFPVPTDQGLLTFEKEGRYLDLHVVWGGAESRYLRVDLAADRSEDKLEGVWNQELGDELSGGGLASWIRGTPRVDGVLVVDDQLDPAAGTSYPYTAEGTAIEDFSRRRTLVVYGVNLPDMADGAAVESLSSSIGYTPDFRSGDDRRRTIDEAFARAGVEPAADADVFIVTANLNAGVTPGSKTLSVNGAPAAWPLVFADQAARLRFARSGNVPTEVFYEGDSGFVEISYQTDMPIREVAIRLLMGDRIPEEIGVLLASRQDDDDPLFTTFRSETFQLYSREDERRSPPEDGNALRVPVLEGMVLQAALLDRAQAVTIPPVARAEILSNPSQLGALWKEALDRVAACNGETVEDYEAYQLEDAENVSRLVITELQSRNIPLKKGDQAAALLIRDEFVKLTLELLPDFERQAGDIAQARAARKRARQSPGIAASPFWHHSEVLFVKEGFFWDEETDYRLADTLDPQKIAEQNGVTEEEARTWAEEQTVAAAKAHVEKMEMAASRALEAGDCDIGELLLIAGHRSEPVVSRIMPRLVKLESIPGPPPRQYWVADRTAQGFVKGLYIPGAAVRALDEYAEADTAVAAAVAAIATAGLSLGLEVAGAAAASVWVSLTDAAVGLLMGAFGVEKYYAGEDYYEFAQGAATALGSDVLDSAEARRQSAVMTALGVILPAAAGASNLNQLRHFKNVQKGRALFERLGGAIDDAADLPQAQQAALASYYADMVRRVRRSGLSKLGEADRAAFSTFEDAMKARGATPPSAVPPEVQARRGIPESAPEPVSRPAPDMEETVRIDPGSSDPNEGATQVVPGARPADTAESAAVTQPVPGMEDTIVRRPGAGASGEAAPQPAPAARPAAAPPSSDFEDTVRVSPGSSDPNEMATQVNPNPGAGADADAPAQPRQRRPGEAFNLYDGDPGARVADRPEGYLQSLIEKSASGQELTPEEVLDKLDYMRLERQRALDSAAEAPAE